MVSLLFIGRWHKLLHPRLLENGLSARRHWVGIHCNPILLLFSFGILCSLLHKHINTTSIFSKDVTKQCHIPSNG